MQMERSAPKGVDCRDKTQRLVLTADNDTEMEFLTGVFDEFMALEPWEPLPPAAPMASVSSNPVPYPDREVIIVDTGRVR